MLTNQITGILTEEQVRRQQLLKYNEDAKKYAEKLKEKEKKKKAERWERYSHVDIGTPLSPGNGTDMAIVRDRQQNHYDEGIHGCIEELERENARLRREKEKRRDKLQKLAHVDTGRSLAGSSQTAYSPPKYRPSILPFENGSINLQLPRTSELDVNKNASSDSQKQEDNSNTIDEKKREEEHRREMRQVREKMQALYSQGVKKTD